MNKRTLKIVSLVLAIVMAISLLPLAALAEEVNEGTETAVVTEEPTVPEEPAEPETGSVVAVIWSKATQVLLDEAAQTPEKKLFATMSHSGIEDLTRNYEPSRINPYATGVPILGKLQTAASVDEVPNFTLVLLDENGNEVGTFKEDTEAKGSDIVIETITDENGPMDSSLDALNKIHSSRYKVFRADGIVEGTYTLGIKDIPEPYGLVAGTLDVGLFDVVAGETTMIGESTIVSGFTEKDHGGNTGWFGAWVSDWKKTNKTLAFTGVSPEFRKETLGFKFRTTDVAGDPVKGAEFVMVNRDELLGLLEPVVGVGKVVFTTAIQNLGDPEVFSFEELVQLHTNLLKQNEQGYIALDMESVYGIIQAYLGLLSGAGPEVLAQFIDYDEAGNFAGLKHPLPAVLSAKSDENGVVTFTESSNVTLTWLVTIITDYGLAILEPLAATNPLLQTLLPLVKAFQIMNHIEDVDFAEIGAEELISLLNDIPDFGMSTLAGFKNTILGAAAQYSENLDAIMDIWPVREAIKGLGSFLVNSKATLLEYVYSTLQGVGILGDKISKGNYLLFEYKTPDAVLDEEGDVVEDFSRSLLVYTVNIDWKEPDNIYASVTDLGLIGPYVAPQFYDFVRNTQYEGVVAKYLGKKTWDYDFLSKLMTGQIALAEKEKQQVEAAFTAFMAYSLYDSLDLNLLFSTRIALMEGMNDYIVSRKDTAANLREYVNAQAKKTKSVYAGTLTPLSAEVEPEELWTFYTLDASPTTTATKLIDKSSKDIAAAFPDGSERQAGIKQNGETASKIVGAVGKKIEDTNKKVADAIKQAATKFFGTIASNIKTDIETVAKNIVSNIFGNLFGGKTANA